MQDDDDNLLGELQADDGRMPEPEPEPMPMVRPPVLRGIFDPEERKGRRVVQPLGLPPTVSAPPQVAMPQPVQPVQPVPVSLVQADSLRGPRRPHVLFPSYEYEEIISLEVLRGRTVVMADLEPTYSETELRLMLTERWGPGRYTYRGVTTSGDTTAEFNAIVVNRVPVLNRLQPSVAAAKEPENADVARLRRQIEERDDRARARERDLERQVDALEDKNRALRRDSAENEMRLLDQISELKRLVRDLQNAPADGLSREVRERIAEARAMAEFDKKSPAEEAMEVAIAESIPKLVGVVMGGFGGQGGKKPPIRNVLAEDD